MIIGASSHGERSLQLPRVSRIRAPNRRSGRRTRVDLVGGFAYMTVYAGHLGLAQCAPIRSASPRPHVTFPIAQVTRTG